VDRRARGKAAFRSCNPSAYEGPPRHGFTRRDFLKVTGTAGATILLGQPALSARASSFKTLPDAFAAARFDPGADGAFTAVFCADTHYGHGDPNQILPPIIKEVNAMAPKPAFFAVNGDLICAASLSFGHVPNEAQKKQAIAEFRLFKEHLGAPDPSIPVKLTLGNHDTNPSEDEPVLFHTVFPDRPEFYSFDVKGIHFTCLNGGSSGYIDPEQREWFRGDVKQNHKPRATLVVVCHQPSIGSVVAERGITETIRDALSNASGRLWFIGGHIHANRDRRFQLRRSTISEITVTTANPAIWGSEKPGYWIYGFAAGKMAVRVFRKLGDKSRYELAPLPVTARPQPIRLPFEGQRGILWKVMVGEGDKPYLVEAKAAWCQNYWHYNRRLMYKFPLSLAGGKALRFGLLERASGREPRKYFVSPDGNNWREVKSVKRDKNSLTTFPIPADCRKAGKLAVRIERCAVSGFALMR